MSVIQKMILIKITIQPFFRTMVVLSSQPTLNVHYVNMQLLHTLSFVKKHLSKFKFRTMFKNHLWQEKFT